MTEKKHLPRPVLLVPTPQETRTIGFERKPVADQRRILIDGISAKSNFALRKRLRLWD